MNCAEVSFRCTKLKLDHDCAIFTEEANFMASRPRRRGTEVFGQPPWMCSASPERAVHISSPVARLLSLHAQLLLDPSADQV